VRAVDAVANIISDAASHSAILFELEIACLWGNNGSPF
jgi:hypothetical protein